MIKNTYRLTVNRAKSTDKWAIHIDYRSKDKMWFCDLLYISSLGNGSTVKAAFDQRFFVTNWICDKIMIGQDIESFDVYDVLPDRKYHAEVSHDPERGDPYTIEVDDSAGSTLKTERHEQLINAINDVFYWIL